MQIFFIHLELVYSFNNVDCRIMIHIALNHKPFFDWKVSTVFPILRKWSRETQLAAADRVRRVYRNQNKNISDWQIEARFTVRNFRRRSITDGVLSFLL